MSEQREMLETEIQDLKRVIEQNSNNPDAEDVVQAAKAVLKEREQQRQLLIEEEKKGQ